MSVFGSIMSAIFGHGSAQASASPTAPPTAPPAQTVDVADIVDKAAAATGEKLAWRTSIVDLMKALEPRQQPVCTQAACHRTQIHRQYERLCRHECLAAQADHAETCRQWRKAAERYQGLTPGRRQRNNAADADASRTRTGSNTSKYRAGCIGGQQWDFLIS